MPKVHQIFLSQPNQKDNYLLFAMAQVIIALSKESVPLCCNLTLGSELLSFSPSDGGHRMSILRAFLVIRRRRWIRPVFSHYGREFLRRTQMSALSTRAELPVACFLDELLLLLPPNPNSIKPPARRAT